MNCIIPFEKKLKFEGNIKEIVSISLEHEVTQNDDEVLGNFIVSGTYKEHELSVNTEDFKFVIPFSVELEKPIEKDSFDFWIDNFTYDIKDNEMLVKIDYGMSAEEIRHEEPVDLIVDTKVEEDKKVGDEIVIENEDRKKEATPQLEPEKINEDARDESFVDDTLNSIDTEEDYITFKIHIVKEEETLESICLTNNIDKDELLKLNDISEIKPQDKIIIPFKNE